MDVGLGVDFPIPGPYEDRVRRLELSVFQPSELDDLSCEDIAFGNPVGDPVQSFLFELDATLNARIARTGRKLIVVRAQDASGGLVVAGCAEVGELRDTETIMIPAHPATLTTVEAGAFGSPQDGTPLPEAIEAHLTDVRGAPLPNVEVLVSVLQGFGPDGSEGPKSQILRSDGEGALAHRAR